MVTDDYIIITENQFETQRRWSEVIRSRCQTGWDVSRGTGMPPLRETICPPSRVWARRVSVAVNKTLAYFLFPVRRFAPHGPRPHHALISAAPVQRPGPKTACADDVRTPAVCRVGLRGCSCSAVCVCVSLLLEVLTGVPQTRAKRDPSTSTVFKGFAPCVAISVLMFGAEYHEPCGLSPQFASV